MNLMFTVLFGIIGAIASCVLMINGMYGFTCGYPLFSLFGMPTEATSAICYIAGTILFILTAGKYIIRYLLNCMLKDE